MLAAGFADIIVPLSIAAIAAVGGMAVSWRRLTVMGTAELGKLEAEKAVIIQTAEDRAVARALEALKLALEVTERERDRALRELQEARKEISAMRERLVRLEAMMDRRIEQVAGSPKRRKDDRG